MNALKRTAGVIDPGYNGGNGAPILKAMKRLRVVVLIACLICCGAGRSAGAGADFVARRSA